MRNPLLSFGLTSLATIALLSACDYEWKDEPPPSEVVEVEVPAEDEVAPEESEEKDAAPASNERPVLAPGKLMASSENVPKDWKKLSILDLEATGKVTIESAAAGPDAGKLFDDNDESLVRTDNVNPLKVTLTFTEPVKLKGVRVVSTYSDYNWSMTAEGGERIVLEAIPEGAPSVLVLPAPVATKKITFEVLRRSRDNYVHANEISLFE